MKKNSSSLTAVTVQHIAVTTDTPYEEFSNRLIEQLGNLDFAEFQRMVKHSASAKELQQYLEAGSGSTGLILFTTYDQGAILTALYGASQKGVAYVLGNPAFAARMTKEDFRAGLYAPLRVYVYATESNKARVEYDLPSSVFSQFENGNVTGVSKELDSKLSRLIEQASQ